MRKKPRGKEWKDFLHNKSIGLPSIGVFELFLGAELSQNREKNLNSVKELVQNYPIFPFSTKSGYIAAQIYAKLQKTGQLIEINDIYIAAITLENDCTLATDNIKHFKRIEALDVLSI